MTTKYSINFAPSTVTAFNRFSAIWQVTRIMKAAGWIYKSSGDGNVKDTSGVAANDRWGGNADPTTDTYPATTINGNQTSNNSTLNVVSTAGFPTSGGTFFLGGLGLNITYTGISGNSFTGCTGGTGSTTTNGSAVTLLDTYSAWWCAEGPSTVKLGISSASTGTFQRGEIVTQTGTGATGELLGYVINAAGTTGWMGIMPQTGTFNSSGVITGGTSGATVTPTAYNLIRRQMVFAKNTNVQQGWIFYEALMDTEIAASSNTALFSDLAANAANCTAAVAPGNSNSGSNRFPLYGIACIGISEGAGQTYDGLFSDTIGKAQIACVNATPSAGVSADGSWFLALSVPTTDYRMIGFTRLDNTEPGDVDPYVFYSGSNEACVQGNIGAAQGRVQGTPSGQGNAWSSSFLNAGITSNTMAKGYCARTTGTIGSKHDQYAGFVYSVTNPNASNNAFMGISTSLKMRNHPDAAGAAPIPIEMFTVGSPSVGLTMRKGTMRWLGVIPVGALNDTADNKKWLVVLPTGSSTPAVVVGPMDGSTVPVTT